MKTETMLTDRKTELANCTFVKAVLMISIVFYHSIVFWRGDWNVAHVSPAAQSPVLYALIQWLAGFQNYAFVFASGYLFYYVKFERGGYSRFGSFIANKAKRLLIPFLFVGAVWVIPISCLYLKQDLFQTVKDYLLVRDAGQLWFLFMLFGVFLIFWPLSNFFAKHHWAGLFAVLGVYAIRFALWGFIPSVFSIWNITRYLVIFWLGFQFRQGFLDVLRKIPAFVWVIVYTLLVICEECVTLPHSTLNKLFGYGVEFVVHAVGAVMAFILLQKLANLVRWQGSKVFSFFAGGSMVIYLFHQQVIYFTVRIFNGVIDPHIHAVVNFAVAMVISSAIAWVLTKFRVTRFLVGEKVMRAEDKNKKVSLGGGQ